MNDSTIPNHVFLMFAVRNSTGGFDIKKTTQNFQEHFQAFAKAQAELHPAIIAELKNHGRLGGTKLVAFTMHALNLKATKENTDRIQNAIEELKGKGLVTYQTTEAGHSRGRGAGYVLVSKDPKPATPVS